MLEQNVETLVRQCWRVPTDAQIEESLARFESRLAPGAQGRWLAAVAAALVVAIALWITLHRPDEAVKTPVTAPQEDPKRKVAEKELAELDAKIRETPDDAGSYVARGGKLLELGRIDEARRDAERAIELNPARPQAWLLRAGVVRRSGRTEDAIMDVTRAIELDPKIGAAYVLRGDLRFARGDMAGARGDYEVAARLDPKSADVQLVLARLEWTLGNFEGALQTVEQALRLGPDRADAWALRAQLRIQKGQLEEAAGDVRRAMELGVLPEAELMQLGGRAAPILERLLDSVKDEAARKRLKERLAVLRDIERHVAALADEKSRAKAKAALLEIGEAALPALDKALYHEEPEVRTQTREIAREIRARAEGEAWIKPIRAAVKKVRERWTKRDFTDISEVVYEAFNREIRSVHYVPKREIGDRFEWSTDGEGPDVLPREFVAALDKGDGMAFVDAGGGLIDRSGMLIFTLPDKSGWSAYVIVRLLK